jgi:hypothetical protein
MNISKLPDDAIKHIESFVDKRPPFADELLNYDFRIYEFHRNELLELPNNLKHVGIEVVNNHSLVSQHPRKKFEYSYLNETLYGYNVFIKDKLANWGYRTIGHIMLEPPVIATA